MEVREVRGVPRGKFGDYRWSIVQGLEDLRRVVEYLAAQDFFASDVESTGLALGWGDEVCGWALATPEMAWYVPVRHRAPAPESLHEKGDPHKNLDPAAVAAALRPLYAGTKPAKVFHHAPMELAACRVEGIQVGGFHDTMSMVVLFDSRLAGLKKAGPAVTGKKRDEAADAALYELARKRSGRPDLSVVEVEKVAEYACRDAVDQARIAAVLLPRIPAAARPLYDSMLAASVLLEESASIGVPFDREGAAFAVEGWAARGKAAAASATEAFGRRTEMDARDAADALWRFAEPEVSNLLRRGKVPRWKAVAQAIHPGGKLLAEAWRCEDASGVVEGILASQASRCRFTHHPCGGHGGGIAASVPVVPELPGQEGVELRSCFVPGPGAAWVRFACRGMRAAYVAAVSEDEEMLAMLARGRGVGEVVAFRLAQEAERQGHSFKIPHGKAEALFDAITAGGGDRAVAAVLSSQKQGRPDEAKCRAVLLMFGRAFGSWRKKAGELDEARKQRGWWTTPYGRRIRLRAKWNSVGDVAEACAADWTRLALGRVAGVLGKCSKAADSWFGACVPDHSRAGPPVVLVVHGQEVSVLVPHGKEEVSFAIHDALLKAAGAACPIRARVEVAASDRSWGGLIAVNLYHRLQVEAAAAVNDWNPEEKWWNVFTRLYLRSCDLRDGGGPMAEYEKVMRAIAYLPQKAEEVAA